MADWPTEHTEYTERNLYRAERPESFRERFHPLYLFPRVLRVPWGIPSELTFSLEILHVRDALGVGEREAVGANGGEADVQGPLDVIVHSVNAFVHQDATFRARTADAGDAN